MFEYLRGEQQTGKPQGINEKPCYHKGTGGQFWKAWTRANLATTRTLRDRRFWRVSWSSPYLSPGRIAGWGNHLVFRSKGGGISRRQQSIKERGTTGNWLSMRVALWGDQINFTLTQSKSCGFPSRKKTKARQSWQNVFLKHNPQLNCYCCCFIYSNVSLLLLYLWNITS